MSSGGALEHLPLALSAASMHTWSWDIPSGRVEWSTGIAALVGLSPEDFGGTFEAYQSVLHPDDAPTLLAALRNALDDPSVPYDIEHRVCLPDGAVRWLACRGQVVRSESGEPLSMLGVVWDITARKVAATRIAEAEAALRQSEERKRMLIEQAEELHARLLRADWMASLGRLAAGVAHEINNPLAYMALNHEIAASKLALLPADPEVLAIRRALSVAREGTDRVRRIVRELATFGRTDGEALSAIDVHRVLDGAFAIAENEIRHRARFTRTYASRRLVRANESRLGQVFVNLLVNAADAIEEGSVADNEIRVETSMADDGRVVVSVSDTGIGIKANAKDRIFDPFFTTKPSGVGTGLGLWICHNIVTSIGGEITVENNEGRGATVRVILAADGDVTPECAREPSSPRLPLRRARILVVDDEPAIGQAIAEVLTGHEVTVATGGRIARELAASQSFDCILCDVMMPDLGGPELFEALEQDGRGLEQRIVFMTAETFVPRAQAFLSAVPNPCLTKPFDRSDLESVIANVLGDAST